MSRIKIDGALLGLEEIDRPVVVVDGIVELVIAAGLGSMRAASCLLGGKWNVEVDGERKEVEVLDISSHPMVGTYVVVRLKLT